MPSQAPQQSLPPEWLRALMLLQQQRTGQPGQQPQPTPALPPLLPYGERVLNNQQPYTTGEIKPIREMFPTLNAAGRAAKQNPLLGMAFGGLADLASTVGSSEFKPSDSLAAVVDVLPMSKYAFKGASHLGAPLLQKAGQWYNRLPARGKTTLESVWNAGPTNPFERQNNDPIYQ